MAHHHHIVWLVPDADRQVEVDTAKRPPKIR